MFHVVPSQGKARQIDQAIRYCDVLRSKGRLTDGQRTPKQAIGLIVFGPLLVNDG